VEERSGLLRCSPHFYNTDEDVDRLLDALSVLSA
jgi:selenocysteine lyase/cysteine desulfurase